MLYSNLQHHFFKKYAINGSNQFSRVFTILFIGDSLLTANQVICLGEKSKVKATLSNIKRICIVRIL